MQILPNGIGIGGGHVLLTRSPLIVSGNVWFVDSVSGADAASPRGLNAEYPLATLDQAVTNAATGDIIVLRSTHNETVTSSTNIGGKQLTIIGEGRTGSVPSATLRNGCSAAPMLEFTTNSKIINVRFVQADDSPDYRSHLEINGSSIGAQVLFCQFETGQTDTVYVRVNIEGPSLYALIEDCVFKSTSTSITAAPKSLLANAGAPCYGLTVRRCTFDGGQSGFAAPGYGVDFTYQPVTDLHIEDVALINGADIGLHANTTGLVHTTASGASRVTWL